ncbi:MAG: hypothetical protein LBC64_08975 [Fibromonadaceae bacterium]|jgi:uncharacterized protein (TIGR02145 family)|nr:hypothetical protein [Fibromonadaceae bacterium]
MVLRFFLFAAIFLLASCTDFERNNPDDTGSINYAASLLNYQGETYKTVVIGSQTWMARNLNYDVPDNNTDVCYNNNPANCNTYGRLYDWTTAMKLPPSCNTSSCATSISSKHQGICPNGWHIPTDADWEVLMNAVGGETAAIKLKATSGWNIGNGYIPGTDIYGFSALPGGYGTLTTGFNNAGFSLLLWSSSEYNSSSAYRRCWDNDIEYVKNDYSPKIDLHSVRCVKD